MYLRTQFLFKFVYDLSKVKIIQICTFCVALSTGCSIDTSSHTLSK